MQVILEEVRNEDKTSKAGKPYVATSISVKGVWYSGFGGYTTKDWAAGMTVECELYEEEYNGKMYKKFKTLSTAQKVDAKTDELKEHFKVLVKEVKDLKKRMDALEGFKDDLPFDKP